MTDAPLRVSEAGRRLGLTTKQVLLLICEREIPFVMVDGIAHVPMNAIGDSTDHH